MRTQDFLSDLASRDIILSASGDHLDVDGPVDVLTDELLATLRAHKAELLEILAGDRVQASVFETGLAPLLVTAGRICATRQKFFPWPLEACADLAEELNQFGENVEAHDSALLAVEVILYNGRRIRIPQHSTPAGWTAPF